MRDSNNISDLVTRLVENQIERKNFIRYIFPSEVKNKDGSGRKVRMWLFEEDELAMVMTRASTILRTLLTASYIA